MQWWSCSSTILLLLLWLRHCKVWGKVHGRTQESRWVGSFCFQADQNVLGLCPSSSRGSGGVLPRENFGKMEPNPAILCILAVKTEWLQHGPLTKSTQKLKKNSFGWADLVAAREGSSEPPNPPPPCVRAWSVTAQLMPTKTRHSQNILLSLDHRQHGLMTW